MQIVLLLDLKRNFKMILILKKNLNSSQIIYNHHLFEAVYGEHKESSH